MTIAMIGQKGLPARSGGIERHVQCLAEGLVSRGHRVIVFGRKWYVKDEQAPAGVEQVFSAGIHTKHLDALTYSLTALFKARKYRPDVVHIHGVGIGLLAPIARLLHPRATVIVTFHCLDRVFSKWGVVARFVFRLGEILTCYTAHRTITVSQYLLDYCLNTYGVQTAYISHPFILPEFAQSPDALKAHNLEDKKYLLFVGRLLRHKGAHLLVNAYEKARAEQPALFADVKLAIVGGGSWTDEYVASLKQTVEKVPGVVMTGEILGDDLRAIQSHALAHVFPTWEEGLSVAVLEAGVSGRPVVHTDLLPNLEATGGNAIAVRTKDVDDICRGLIQVVRMSENERKLIADATRNYIEKQFNYDDGIDAVERLYREMCTGERTLTTQSVASKI